MNLVGRILEVIVLTISAVGTMIVLWGIGDACTSFVRLKMEPPEGAVGRSETIRQKLGAHLLLGLEVFIAADIISSAVSPTWQKVGTLAAIVGVRTVLSYFLRMELRQEPPR